MLRDLFKHMSEFDLSFFSNSTASQFVRHFLLKGTLQDIEVLQKRLRRLLGDLTFLEAFILSGINSPAWPSSLLFTSATPACLMSVYHPGLKSPASSHQVPFGYDQQASRLKSKVARGFCPARVVLQIGC